MSRKVNQVICVERDTESNAQIEDCGLQRVVPPLDVLAFDQAMRVLMLAHFTEFPKRTLPEINIEPRPLHEKFMAWASASLELNSAELALNGGAAFYELMRNKKTLELYLDLLRRKALNTVEIAQTVQAQPRVAVAIGELHADILERPSDYFGARSPLPYLLLTTLEYSRFLKSNL